MKIVGVTSFHLLRARPVGGKIRAAQSVLSTEAPIRGARGERRRTHGGEKRNPSVSRACVRLHGRRPCRERSEERRVGKECRSRCDWSSDVCSSDLSWRPGGAKEDSWRREAEPFG